VKFAALILAVLIAGRLFWLGFRSLEMGAWSIGGPMIAAALWICLTIPLKK